uniref:Uncharacterized protein n=1 Tax=Mycena chlorophos TaxID=658473 RepID=A0ABQ0M990_MYCCL|nr:predicted protein [Mycena chlorophos]
MSASAAAVRRWRRDMRLLDAKLKGNLGNRKLKLSPGNCSSGLLADYVADYGRLILERMESCRRVQRLVSYSSRARMKRSDRVRDLLFVGKS